MHKMPGQRNDLKHRKRKNMSEATYTQQGSATRRKCVTSQKTHSEAESSSAGGDAERLSRISCECLQLAGRRRCSASPLLDGQEGKENALRSALVFDNCAWYDVRGGLEAAEGMDCEETDKNVFPDDDSNQILPVEQFFGNLDAVQDFPQRTPATSSHHQKQRRRRHYFAREESDESNEEAHLEGMPKDDGISTL
ncbi:UPF0688 protein C1orf174 homolog isoform X1 [Syngnathus typhle]|uniref:UPF0688 protein C1orf174 homolog isoform X1 n=2 Tax=Syngnathus typhle TaxID=161592 RepID=UPI002A6A9820|nr:UPF0688 protein C1orf174 homolog isoform X1 [Syngnathus typhle]